MDGFQSSAQLIQFRWEHRPKCNGQCASALPCAMVPRPSALPCSFAELQAGGCPWLSLWQQFHFLRWEAFVVTLSVDLTYLCGFCFCLRCWQVLGWCMGQPSHLLPKEFLSEESPPCQQRPTAPVPLQRPWSLSVERARAATCSSSRFCLLARETEQKLLHEIQQASSLGPCQCRPPSAECKGEASFWSSVPQGLSSLLLLSDGDGRVLQQGQQQPQCSTSSHLQEEERRAIVPVFSKLTC